MPINLPESDDLYHMMWQLMRRRPNNVSPVDEGNLELVLNEQRVGKNPIAYNYLEQCSVEILELKIEALFFLELHQRIEENIMDGKPNTTQQVVYSFICEYGIHSITEDALIKHNYRRLAKCKRNQKKRSYNKKC
jgi:hypothetical protein